MSGQTELPKYTLTAWTDKGQRITARDEEVKALNPEPHYPGWCNYVSQRSVRALAVSPNKQIWLGTSGGVLAWNRGEKLYRRYSSEHGLASNTVSCLCLDQAERAWVGHVEGGLSYFDGQQWQIVKGLQDQSLRVICSADEADQANGIWAATARGLYRISAPDREAKLVEAKLVEAKLVAERRDGAADVLALLADGEHLLLGTSWGLFRLRSPYNLVPIAPATIENCTALACDKRGRIYVGTAEGIYWLEGDSVAGPIVPEDQEFTERVLALASGGKRLWVLTTRGLSHIVDQRWQRIAWTDDDEAPALWAIDARDETYLWAGSDNRLVGIWHTDARTDWDLAWLPAHAEDKLNNLGRCIAPQAYQGKVWVGSAGGLLCFDAEGTPTIKPAVGDVQGLCVTVKRGLAHQKKKILWFLSRPHGIGHLSPRDYPTFETLSPPGLPTALAAGRDKKLYVLTSRGLWKVTNETMGIKQITKNLPPAPVRHLLQSPKRVWWAGTTRGLYYLVDNHYWRLAGEQPGPLQARINGLLNTGPALWVATENGLWKRYHHKWHHHPFRSVRALARSPSRHGLWVAHEDGISCYDLLSGKTTASYTRFNSGLGSHRITALFEGAGVLWVVTQTGISRFNLKGESA